MADAAKTAEQELAEKQKTAYRNAMKRLREENVEAFNKLRVEEAAKLNITWTPKPTEEQKAAEQLARLIETYPHLAEELRRGATPEADPGEPVDPEA